MSGGVGVLRRPGIVTFIGFVIYIQAFLSAVAGVVLLAFRGDIEDFLSSNGVELSKGEATGSAIGSLVVALFLFIVGAGIIRGSRAGGDSSCSSKRSTWRWRSTKMVVHPHWHSSRPGSSRWSASS